MDYHSSEVTGLSVCLSVWCPQLQTAVLTWPLNPVEKPLAPASHSSSRTDTDTRAEAGNSVSVFVIGQAVQFVLVKAPWAEKRRRSRKRGVRGWVAVRSVGCYLISLGWDPGLCRPDEERRKLNHSPLLWV